MKKDEQVETSVKNARPRRSLHVLFKVLLLLLALAGLAVGYGVLRRGSSESVAVMRTVAGRERYCHNPALGGADAVQSLSPFVFDVQKAPDTVRVFMLGASVAQGYPDPTYSMSRLFEIMMGQAFPTRRFEVINVAIPDMDSDGVRRIAQSCAQYAPDLMIVYMGHNEIIGSTAGKRAQGDAASRDALQRRPDATADALKRFERNLREICGIGTHEGAHVLLSNLASNLRTCPPFASMHRVDLTPAEQAAWGSLYTDGFTDELAETYDSAMAHYLAAAEIDNTFAELQFGLARGYIQQGQPAAALEHFMRAREVDALPFRATDGVNDVIRAVGAALASEGVHVVDAVSAISSNSVDGIPGKALFYDHIHLRFKGSYVIAQAMADVAKDLLSEGSTVGPSLSLVQCRERLVYSALDHYEALRRTRAVVSRPPFPPRTSHTDLPAELETEVLAVKKNLQPNLRNLMLQYKSRIEQYPHDWKLRWKVADYNFRHYKNNTLATFQAEKILESLPHDGARQILMRIAIREGRSADAETYALALLNDRPSEVGYIFDLAEIYKLRGAYEQAIQYFEKGIKLRPGNESILAYIYLGELYEAIGRTEKAIKTLREALDDAPLDHAAMAYVNLGLLLGREHRDEEALKILRSAIATFPLDDIGRKHEVHDLLVRLGETGLAEMLTAHADAAEDAQDVGTKTD
jgi:tetratricopeptide (TPR) repeat protein